MAATGLADFEITSLRGGLNNNDPSISLPNDQCTIMTNVELVRSMLGERRRGTSAITLPATLSGKDRIAFLFRHVPGTDDTAAELYAMGFITAGAVQLARKTTSWSDITINDTINITGFAPYQWSAVSLHGKAFFAFDSDVNRLHVLDAASTTMRRVGLAKPAAPTGADQGSPGTAITANTRYYRVRYTVQSGGATLRRSEPSAVLTFTPDGSHTSVRVTKPVSISEGETHWELEASVNNGDFYVIATTVVGTTTVDDSQVYALGYGYSFSLSEDIEDYSLPWSARYLVSDEDRLMWGGSWEDSAFSSTVGWSPVGNADGKGNDERYEADTDPLLDLDGLEGGPMTGLSSAVAGEIWVSKFSRLYKLVRSGRRSKAYLPICMTKERGALHGSLIAAVDQAGRPCLYGLDPAVGPIRIGNGGIKQCGADIRGTWEGLNLDATKVVCSALYYPANRQVIWNIATGSDNIPTISIVLHTYEQRDTDDTGMRRGWTTFSGNRSKALTMCLFATNIEAGTARNRILVPFIGLEGLGLVHRCDTGNDDNAVAYAAQIRTRPYKLKSLMWQFNVKGAMLLAKAVAGSKIVMKCIRDFALETTATTSTITFDASAAGESDVIKPVEELVGSEMRVAQFDFSDPATAGTRFELNQLALTESMGQRS